MTATPLDILYEDNHCLAIAKPSGVVSAHFQGHEETLDRTVKAYLKEKYAKPGNVFLGVVHRLDRPVSGVLLFARTSKAAARLSEQFREGTVEKIYWAVVDGEVPVTAGTLEDWLKKDEEMRRVEVVEPGTRGARQALLHFHQRGYHGGLTWLELRPQTGRTHQLRVQLSHHGHPIYGDARYGSLHVFKEGIALHARSLTFLHPIRFEPITVTAELPRVARALRIRVQRKSSMSDALTAMRDVIQVDVAGRGLRADPKNNLITACPGDFAAACRSIAETPDAAVAIFTGFVLPTVHPPSAETDGPLGAIFLARALTPLGIRVCIVTDWFSQKALQVGLEAAGLADQVTLQTLAPLSPAWLSFVPDNWLEFANYFGLTHMIAVEWIGPNHSLQSFQITPGGSIGATMQEFMREVPLECQNRCHTMKGIDISETTSPAHRLFEITQQANAKVKSIGIGDGGNEIGMGKIPWSIIRRNIPNGARIACRVPTDWLIVAGVSNWGAYGLAAGVRKLRKAWPAPDLLDPRVEIRVLKTMVTNGPLVDGVTGKATLTVDGLPWDRYSGVLKQLAAIP